MAELLDCPECRKQVRVPEELLGKQVRCPTCGATFRAGGRAGSAPPRESRRPAREPDPYDDDYVDDYDDRPRRGRRRYRGDLQPHRGGMILVFGILGLAVFGPVFGPMAWIMGNNDLQAMREGRMDPEGEGNTQAGRICGMIATIMSIIGLVMACCWLGVIFSLVGAAGRAH